MTAAVRLTLGHASYGAALTPTLTHPAIADRIEQLGGRWFGPYD